MDWHIPNIEQYVIYSIKEIFRWSGDNPTAIIVITNTLALLKVWAVKSHRSLDDKIITLLLSFFTFQWVKELTTSKDTPKDTKG